MSNKKTVLIGAVILLVAALIVLGSILVPIWSARGRMKDTLRAASATDVQYMLVSDPLLETDDALGNDGREIMLAPTQQTAVSQALQALCDAFSYDKKEQKVLGAWDMCLSVKSAAGKMVSVYFTSEAFYCMEGDVAFFFTPDDTDAYAVLYEMLCDTLQ